MQTPTTTPEPYQPPKGVQTTHTLKLFEPEDLQDANPTRYKESLSYQATADWMVLRKKEKAVAEMFYVFYQASPTTNLTGKPRPVTFVFNGGPGAASAYLHIGALGPKRVIFNKDGSIPRPPAQLTDNQESWLSFTDLVFIDPIGTGFSRTVEEVENAKKPNPAPDEKQPPKQEGSPPKEFYQLNRDLESLGEFMSKFLSKYKLWSAPVFLAGESYGGFRVGKLVRKLQEEIGIGLSGAILISPALELSLLQGCDYDALPWLDLFPSLVLAAHHHRKSKVFSLDTSLQEIINTAEQFATQDLAALLTQGALMPSLQKNNTLARIAELLGINPEFISKKEGRISCSDYSREILRSEQKICGLYDASMTVTDPFPDRDNHQGPEPTLSAAERVFTGGINTQLRQVLGLETERDYHTLSMEVNETWKVDGKKHAFDIQIGATDDLRYGMALNPYMKVFIAHGYYDLVTPYFSSHRLSQHMKLTQEQKKNLILKHFKGGHMFYTWDESRKLFKSEIENLYRNIEKN